MKEYNQIFEWYTDTRNNTTGVASVKSAFQTLNPNSTVIDLGCGTGFPLAEALIQMQLNVIGVDSSSRMIEAFNKNFPHSIAYHASIQDYVFPEFTVDGVLCWGCLFHLTPADQRTVLARTFRAINSGGRILFTSAFHRDQTRGEMNGIVLPYFSLGSAEYNALAKASGFRLIHEKADNDGNYEYLFEKA